MSDYFGWRQAFFVAAVPGLFLAAVCALTLKEPRKRLNAAAQAVADASGQALATFGETFRYLRTKRAFWFMAWGAGIRSFLGYGHGAFGPSFFYRCHGIEIASLAAHFHMRPQTFVGLALGVTAGVTGTLGSYIGGQIADRLGARDLRVYGSVPALAVILALPVTFMLYTTPSTTFAMSLIAVNGLLGTLWYGPVYASAQGMVPQRMRAMSASLMLFVINFLGLVLGAVCVGAFSDLLNNGFHLGAAEGIRWALVLSSVGGAVSAPLFWFARKNMREEMVS
jgi:predicted MFS family arabinose efflux permease